MYLSNNELENICEAAYYRTVNNFCDFEDVTFKAHFQQKAQNYFDRIIAPQINLLYSDSSQSGIISKWQSRLNNDAGIWYENKEIQKKEESKRLRENQESERLREEYAAEQRQLKKEDNLQNQFRQNVDYLSELVDEAIAKGNLDEIEKLDRRLSDEIKAIKAMVLDKVATSRRSDFDVWTNSLYDEKVRLSDYIERIKVEETEEAERQEAELAAKRKAQNEVNKKKLEEIQNAWRNQQSQPYVENNNENQNKKTMSETSTCPQCGSEVSATAKFCTTCGMKLTNTCANCGASLKPTSKFCTECGTPVGGSAPQSPSSTAPTPKADSPEPMGEPSEEIQAKEPTVPKATAKTDMANSAPTLAEIKEKGGIIVYDDENSEDEELADKLSDILLSDFFEKELEAVNSFIETFSELFDSDDVEWHEFGVPAFDRKERIFPFWDLYKPSSCKYTIVEDNMLVLIGDGMPFDIRTEEEEEETEYNYWVLNPDILQLKDKITHVAVTCEGVSDRLFKDFTNLKYVLLTGNLTRIKTSGFEGCPIKFMLLPPTLESIDNNAFKGAKFEFVNILPLTSDPDEWDFSKDSFVKCKELKFVFIPKRIMDRFDVEDFFRGCNSLDTDYIWNLDDIKEQIEAFEGGDDSEDESNNENTNINTNNSIMEEIKLTRKKGNDGWGYVDENGNWVIEPKFDDAWNFEEGSAMVELDCKYGYIKTDGSWLVEPKFDGAGGFHEGFARVKLDGKYGYIKTDGSWLVEPKFDDVSNFQEGFAQVKLDGKAGIIRTDGSWFVEPKFDYAGSFEDGLALLGASDKWGFIKFDGTWQIEPKFEALVSFLFVEGVDEEIAPAKLDKKWGFIKKDGSWLIEPTFDDCLEMNDDSVLVKYEGEKGEIRFDGDTWEFTPNDDDDEDDDW